MRRLALIAALAACGGVQGPRQVQTSFASFDIGATGFTNDTGSEVVVLALDRGTPCTDLSGTMQPDGSYIELKLKASSDFIDYDGIDCSVAMSASCEAFLSVGVPGERPLVHPGLAGTVKVHQGDPSGLVIDIDAVVSKPALDPQSTADKAAVEGEPLKLTFTTSFCR